MVFVIMDVPLHRKGLARARLSISKDSAAKAFQHFIHGMRRCMLENLFLSRETTKHLIFKGGWEGEKD